jgi:hypothetical protein
MRVRQRVATPIHVISAMTLGVLAQGVFHWIGFSAPIPALGWGRDWTFLPISLVVGVYQDAGSRLMGSMARYARIQGMV